MLVNQRNQVFFGTPDEPTKPDDAGCWFWWPIVRLRTPDTTREMVWSSACEQYPAAARCLLKELAKELPEPFLQGLIRDLTTLHN